MGDYSSREYADMVFVYGFCNGNGLQAVREYSQRYPNRRQPTDKIFERTFRRLQETGSVVGKTGGGRPRWHNLENEEIIIDQVLDNPHISTRRIKSRTGLSQSFVWRTINREELYPYHLQSVQGLRPGDGERRIVFCRWLLEQVEEDPHFLEKIIWTDESQFTRDGVTNFHNLHAWDLQNPHVIRQRKFQQRFSINVWAGICNNNLLELHVLENRLHAGTYEHFLENNLHNKIENVPLNIRREMYFQHDGAPPHNGRRVSEWLNQHFGNRWIGYRGPIRWPPRSPDLNPLDFYFWGHMKEIVYSVEIHSQDQLLQRIFEAAEVIQNRPAIMTNVYQSLIRRCRLCIRADGGHFEHLL